MNRGVHGGSPPEDPVVRAQRLEAAGQIAERVADDFNHLLGPMVAYPELIRRQLPMGHPARQYCDTMLEAAERMADLNANLMALGSRGCFDRQPVNLNGLVRQALDQMPAAPDTLVVETALAADLLPVRGSAGRLLRVVAILVGNAREAMRELGRLTVRTANVYLDRPAGRCGPVPPGEHVELEVRDTGPGIPAGVQDRLFDPLFCGKERGKPRGHGLGLSVVGSVVEDHGGAVDVESRAGRGTAFQVYLPTLRPGSDERLLEELPRGRERLMVVDDDRHQRELMAGWLAGLGYRVETASSGEEAVALLIERPADLLILDLVMPEGLDGAATYERALVVQPDLRAVTTSGSATAEELARAQALGAGAHLRKPLKADDLARAVREELDRPAKC